MLSQILGDWTKSSFLFKITRFFKLSFLYIVLCLYTPVYYKSQYGNYKVTSRNFAKAMLIFFSTWLYKAHIFCRIQETEYNFRTAQIMFLSAGSQQFGRYMSNPFLEYLSCSFSMLVAIFLKKILQ